MLRMRENFKYTTEEGDDWIEFGSSAALTSDSRLRIFSDAGNHTFIFGDQAAYEGSLEIQAGAGSHKFMFGDDAGTIGALDHRGW